MESQNSQAGEGLGSWWSGHTSKYGMMTFIASVVKKNLSVHATFVQEQKIANGTRKDIAETVVPRVTRLVSWWYPRENLRYPGYLE